MIRKTKNDQNYTPLMGETCTSMTEKIDLLITNTKQAMMNLRRLEQSKNPL